MSTPDHSPPAAAAQTELSLRVGDWLIEPSLNQVSAAGRTARLEPKAMAVLVHLAECRGQVVSRQALLDSAWPGVVVGDDSLSQVIIKLRKALDAGRGPPSLIQTVAKRGYRLVVPSDPPPSSSPVQHAAERPRRRSIPRGLAAAALLVGLAAAIGPSIPQHDDAEALPPPAAAQEASTRSDPPTLAVEPFQGLSDDPLEVLLARGITDGLLTDLSKDFDLRVVAAPPAASGPTAVSAAAVQYRLSGSVQRFDGPFRVHVHLSDASSGLQLWSERYELASGGLLDLHSDIGPKILRELSSKINAAELRRAAHRYTHNLQAYQTFVRAQQRLLTRQKVDNEAARALYRHAISLDPAFARAYAGLALTHAADYRNRWSDDRAASLGRSFEIAQTALQIDPHIPETYWVLAFVHIERRQHERALQLLKRALAVDPSYADGYALMGGVQTYVGRPSETVPLLRRAMRLDPQAGHLHFLLLGRAYWFLGDLEQARVNLDQALARNYSNLEAHVYLAAVHLKTGDRAAAAWEAHEIRALEPAFEGRSWLQTYPMTDQAQNEQLLQALRSIGL